MTRPRWRPCWAVSLGLFLWAALPGAAVAWELFPAAEIQEAHSLRQRILAEIPQLAPQSLRQHPRLSPEVLALAQERLASLQARETENPFFHWAQGEMVRQTQGSAAAAPAFAQARQIAGPRLLVHWLLWEDYLGRDLSEEARQEERALQAIQLRWGLSRFPLLAAEQMRHGDEAADAGDLTRAAALYAAAVANVPESPAALIGRAVLTWQVDKTRLLQIIRDLASGVAHTLRGTQTGYRLTSNLLQSCLVTWLAALCLVAAILAIKNHPLFIHDLSERWFARFSPTAATRLGLLVLLLPLMGGLGLVWAAIGALLACAPYMRRQEQYLVSMFLVLLLAFPYGYERVAARHVLGASRALSLVQAAEQGGRGDGLLHELRGWAREAPDAGLPRYYLGQVLKRRGNLPEAEEEMTRATRLLPRAGFAQIGLGNIQYLQGRLPEAEATYRAAAEMMPSSAAVQLNLSKLYTQRLLLDPSNEALTKSLKLDPHMVRMVSDFHGQGIIEFVMDESVPWDALAAGLSPRERDVRSVAEAFWGRPLRGVPLPFLPAVAGALLILFWIRVMLRARSLPVRRCLQCQAVFCGKCQSEPREKEYCRACAAAFRQREGVAAFVKLRRLREGEEWLHAEQFRTGVLGSILPGGSDLYRGRILSGVLLALLAVWLLCEGIALDFLTPSLRFAVPVPGPVRWTVALIVLLMLYAYSMQRSWGVSDSERG